MLFNKQSDLASWTAKNGQLGFCLDVKTTFSYDSAGVAWMPLARTVVKTSNVTINGLATGNTKIFTIEPSNLKFYPVMVIFRAINISGTVTPPTVSIGTNSTNYNNITTSSLLSTLLNTIGATNGAPGMVTTSPALSGNTDVYAKVSIAAIGATVYQFQVDIIGYYL